VKAFYESWSLDLLPNGGVAEIVRVVQPFEKGDRILNFVYPELQRLNICGEQPDPDLSPGRNVLFVEMEKYAAGPWPFAGARKMQAIRNGRIAFQRVIRSLARCSTGIRPGSCHSREQAAIAATGNTWSSAKLMRCISPRPLPIGPVW